MLAAHATQRETWPQLRVYAESHAGSPWCGWAYFVLGYQEFQAKSYLQGAEDLGKAAKTGLSLDDFAVFYRASALREANRAADAATVLQDFASRFPRSQLRNQVLELRVNALLGSDQPQPAIDLLSVEPSVRTNPALALLLGQADQQGQHLPRQRPHSRMSTTTFRYRIRRKPPKTRSHHYDDNWGPLIQNPH